MTVKELMERLGKLPAEAKVEVWDEDRVEYVDVTKCTLTDDGSVVRLDTSVFD